MKGHSLLLIRKHILLQLQERLHQAGKWDVYTTAVTK